MNLNRQSAALFDMRCVPTPSTQAVMKPVPIRPDEIDSHPDHFPCSKNRLSDIVTLVRSRSRRSPIHGVARYVKEEENLFGRQLASIAALDLGT